MKERVSAKDRWAKGKAILKGGERESQKSQHSAASGGSSGSAGPQTSAVSVPNMVPRYGSTKNQNIFKPFNSEVISKELLDYQKTTGWMTMAHAFRFC